MNLTMSLHYGYLSSDSFLWREVKTASVGKVSLNLLVELSELSISSIHVPFLCLHTDATPNIFAMHARMWYTGQGQRGISTEQNFFRNGMSIRMAAAMCVGTTIT